MRVRLRGVYASEDHVSCSISVHHGLLTYWQEPHVDSIARARLSDRNRVVCYLR